MISPQHKGTAEQKNRHCIDQGQIQSWTLGAISQSWNLGVRSSLFHVKSFRTLLFAIGITAVWGSHAPTGPGSAPGIDSAKNNLLAGQKVKKDQYWAFLFKIRFICVQSVMYVIVNIYLFYVCVIRNPRNVTY